MASSLRLLALAVCLYAAGCAASQRAAGDAPPAQIATAERPAAEAQSPTETPATDATRSGIQGVLELAMAPVAVAGVGVWLLVMWVKQW